MDTRWSYKNLTQYFLVLPKYYLTLILILITQRYVDNCSAADPKDVWMSSQSEITVKVNESLRLHCSSSEVNDVKNYLFSEFPQCGLEFKQLEEDNPSWPMKFTFRPIDSSFDVLKETTCENESSCSIILENKEESRNDYACYISIPLPSITAGLINVDLVMRLNGEGEYNSRCRLLWKDINSKLLEYRFPRQVSSTIVVVATGPKMVDKISCISYNWEKMTCTWIVPKNYIETNYTIQYKPDDDRHKNFSECPNNDDVSSNSCSWTLSTKPPYYRDYEKLTVIIRGVNQYNNTKQLFNINHFEQVWPEGPSNLRLTNETCTSILLEWDIGEFQDFPRKLIYKITYQPIAPCDPNWLICNPKDIIVDGQNISYVVTNLVPNMVYDFRVRMKVFNSAEKFWSKGDHATNQTRTLSCPPFRSPKTDIGSFHIEGAPSNRTRIVYIYWETLLPFEYNGQNFSYLVEVSRNDSGVEWNQTPVVRLNSKFDSYAKYNIGLFSHSFSITARNNMGKAPYASIVKVPSEFFRIRSDPSLQKRDYEKIIKWSRVPTRSGIDNYTIFFWHVETFRPFQCDSFIRWTHVSGDNTTFSLPPNISSDNQFAISINTPESSSGMMWISNHHINYQRPLMEPDENRLNTTPTIEIGWRSSPTQKKNKFEELIKNNSIIPAPDWKM